MYLLYDHEKGLLQVGLALTDSLSFSRGLHPVRKRQGSCSSKNYIFFISSFAFSPCLPCDYRLSLKNSLVKICFFCFLKTVFFIIKCISSLKEKTIFLFRIKKIQYLFCIVLFFSGFYFFFVMKDISHTVAINKEHEENFQNLSLKEWQNFFQKTLFAKQIQEKKNLYVEGRIPLIKGIRSFLVLPLKSDQAIQQAYSGLLALPFKEVIRIEKNGDIIKSHSVFECKEEKERENYFYRVSENDELILITENNDLKPLNSHHFFLFSEKELGKDFSADHICSLLGQRKVKIDEDPG